NSKYLQFDATSKLKEIEDMPFDVVKLVNKINLDISTHKEIEKELIISQSNAINIFDFLRCQAIKKYKYTRNNIEYTNIKCFLFNNLPPCSIMVASATPQEEFYKLEFFNRKLQIHEVSKA